MYLESIVFVFFNFNMYKFKEKITIVVCLQLRFITYITSHFSTLKLGNED